MKYKTSEIFTSYNVHLELVPLFYNENESTWYGSKVNFLDPNPNSKHNYGRTFFLVSIIHPNILTNHSNLKYGNCNKK